MPSWGIPNDSVMDLSRLLEICSWIPQSFPFGWSWLPNGFTKDCPMDALWHDPGSLVTSTCISQAPPKHSQWLLFGFIIDYFRISYGTPLNSSWISQGFPMESQGIARGCPMDLLRVATTRLIDVL